MVKKAKMQKTDSGEFCLFSLCVLLTSLLPPPCSVLRSIPVPSYLMVNRLGGVPSVSVSAARAPSRKVECRARQRSYSEQSGWSSESSRVPSYQGGTNSIVLRGKGRGGRGQKPAGKEAA